MTRELEGWKHSMSAIQQKIGPDRFQQFADAFLLRFEERILRDCAPDNPGYIRLKELIERRLDK